LKIRQKPIKKFILVLLVNMSDFLDGIQSDKFKISTIPLTKIDFKDSQYKIDRAKDDIASLALSIKENGLAQLPLVTQKGDSYVVVTGFKLIQAMLQNNGMDKVVCLTMPETSEKNCAVLAISDLAFQRQLTPAELIKGLALLSCFMDEKTIAEKSLSIFNVQLNERYIKELFFIHSMPPQMLELLFELLDDCRLSIKSAKKISVYDPGLAHCFLSVFSAVKTSSSKQMDVITCWMEIAARENINPVDLYQENEIQEILLHKNKDAGFKGNLLRSYLHKRRFPFLEKTRDDIQKKIKDLKLGIDIKLILPENFESMTYSIGFDFKNLEEFHTRIATLDRVSKNPALTKILER
jgi:ParB family chromosome partitioning protein